jgi:hypothetical protein
MNPLVPLWPALRSHFQNSSAERGTGIIEHLGFEIPRSPFMPSSGWVTPTKRMVLTFLRPATPMADPITAFMDFIFERLKHKNPDGSLQIMYTIHGQLF